VNEVAGEMITFGAVAPLLAALTTDSKEMQEHATGAILNLAACNIGRVKIMEQKVYDFE